MIKGFISLFVNSADKKKQKTLQSNAHKGLIKLQLHYNQIDSLKRKAT